MKRVIDDSEALYKTCKRLVIDGDPRPSEYCIANSEPYEPQETSEWVLDSDGLLICQKCGEIALQRMFVKMPYLIQDVRMVRSNFCPSCGADMKVGGYNFVSELSEMFESLLSEGHEDEMGESTN